MCPLSLECGCIREIKHINRFQNLAERNQWTLQINGYWTESYFSGQACMFCNNLVNWMTFRVSMFCRTKIAMDDLLVSIFCRTKIAMDDLLGSPNGLYANIQHSEISTIGHSLQDLILDCSYAGKFLFGKLCRYLAVEFMNSMSSW